MCLKMPACCVLGEQTEEGKGKEEGRDEARKRRRGVVDVEVFISCS